MLMRTARWVPQVAVARVPALVTAAGRQSVAGREPAVATDSAGFAAPGGTGGGSSEAVANRHAAAVMAAGGRTPEAREGVAAFLEKRPPHWPT
ncbi:hypothetical protein [Marinactinospora rubrisoli]|uniref:Uncharacterized protein n=1 Tax=Marinactinospora rubrisoli TaxID=2715399 RepID=A0ABW2KI28_9ACTN